MVIFHTPISSPVVVLLTVIYFITSSISVFDTRVHQALRNGTYPPEDPIPPDWVGAMTILHWILGIGLLLLNWKYALVVYAIKFALSVLPVLETVGNILVGLLAGSTARSIRGSNLSEPTSKDGPIPFWDWRIGQSVNWDLAYALERYVSEFDLARPTGKDGPKGLVLAEAKLRVLSDSLEDFDGENREFLDTTAKRMRGWVENLQFAGKLRQAMRKDSGDSDGQDEPVPFDAWWEEIAEDSSLGDALETYIAYYDLLREPDSDESMDITLFEAKIEVLSNARDDFDEELWEDIDGLIDALREYLTELQVAKIRRQAERALEELDAQEERG